MVFLKRCLFRVTGLRHGRPKTIVLGRPLVKRFAFAIRPLSVCLSCQSVCDVGVLCPNGWMDQDETWHAGRPWPWPHCVRWGPSYPSRKGAEPPIFGSYLFYPNGWMDQHATCYGGRPRPKQHCLRWWPASPKRDRAPIFGTCLLWPNGWMDQDATWHGGRSWPRPHCATGEPSALIPERGHSPQFSTHV